MLNVFEGFIDPVYVVSFIMTSYGLRNLISDLVIKITGRPSKRKYGVFVIGLVMGVAFFYINKGVAEEAETAAVVKKLIASYAIGTSLYELIVKWIISTAQKKLKVDSKLKNKN